MPQIEVSSFELLIFAKDGRGLVCSLFADFALSEFDFYGDDEGLDENKVMEKVGKDMMYALAKFGHFDDKLWISHTASSTVFAPINLHDAVGHLLFERDQIIEVLG